MMRVSYAATILVLLTIMLLVAACSSSPEQSTPGAGSPQSPAAGTPQEPGAPPSPQPSPPAGGGLPVGPGPIFRDDLAENQVPAALSAWVRSQYNNPQPAHQVLTEGDTTYIAVTAGQQSSGGYRLDLTGVRLPEAGGRPVITLSLTVVPPPAGSPVTLALTQPVRYLSITPLHVGEVNVTVYSVR